MCRLLAFILFFLFVAIFSSATQSEDEHDFDPLSFLVDPYEHEKTTSAHLSSEHPTNSVAQVHLSDSSPSINPTPQPQRKRLKIKGESKADYQKRKYEHQQILFHSKPNDEKERLTKKKIDHQRNYRMRTKERIGFQSPKQARIAGLKVLQKAGLATEQHQQELKHAILQRQKAQQKFEARKRSQGFKRTAKGWIKMQPDDKLR